MFVINRQTEKLQPIPTKEVHNTANLWLPAEDTLPNAHTPQCICKGFASKSSTLTGIYAHANETTLMCQVAMQISINSLGNYCNLILKKRRKSEKTEKITQVPIRADTFSR